MRESSAGPYAQILGALAASPFQSISYVEGTTSTNADAAALLEDQRFAGHTIVAEYQSRGAGRRGRTWEAAAGTSLLFSTILPAAVRTDRLWLVPFWVALAVRGALEAAGIPAILQWPNDVLAQDRKIAGILCQSQVIGTAARVACGVGINVVRSGARATPIEERAAFCEDFSLVERPALLEAILRNYATSLELLDDARRVVELWEAGAGVPGRRYRIQLDGVNEAFDGTAMRLEIGGALRVLRDDGTTQAVEMADARVLR
ncbi:MAG TPA: biotin--[acetyl-CoA-carboxylase] ligase [Candidatus Cybelea sp.]|nr:biotin--[acetyl-CoA-carboxylase] ligase [Candidatus Cybelea sp.]